MISSEEKKTIVGRYWEEVVNRGALDLVDKIFAPHYVLHCYSPCEDKELHSRDDVKRVVGMLRDQSPGLHADIEEQVVEGDLVVTRYTTYVIPEHHDHQVPVQGINISRVRQGVVEEGWTSWDVTKPVDHESDRRHWCWWC